MNWNRKKTLLAGMAILFALLLSRSAYADPITFTLSQPIQTGAAGTTLDFFGTITNTSATTVFLNSDNSNLSPVLLIDDTPFFALSASLGPNASTGLVELFDVTIAANAAAGSYTGNLFQIMGGDQQNVSVDLLATQQFTVNVTPASSTPEPSTIVLLAGGLAATTLKKRIHRRPS